MNTKILYIAIAILFSLTGCKKKVETMSSVETNGVSITLNVDGGSRVIVDPDGIPYATVTFEENDIIYVGNNGAYCGYLEHDGTNFTGTVSPSSVDDYLHFYFMGNKGGTDSAPSSVSITDQTDHYPVIAYAHSTELFNPEVTSYTAKLQLYCALVKFITTDIPQATPITITGMNNTVGVNFEANCGATTGQPYSFSKSDNGKIKLHAESNTERWAILLPQDETSNAMAFINGTRYSTANAFTVPEITPNMFYNNDDIEVNLEQTYELLGEFTINDSGDKVAFSKGNLQYQASTDTWRFAENQLSVIGEDNQNISPTYSGWIDLFGWGTSGWDNGNWCYHPCSTYSISPSSSSSSSYAIHEARGFGYGPIDPDGYVY